MQALVYFIDLTSTSQEILPGTRMLPAALSSIQVTSAVTSSTYKLYTGTTTAYSNTYRLTINNDVAMDTATSVVNALRQTWSQNIGQGTVKQSVMVIFKVGISP